MGKATKRGRVTTKSAKNVREIQNEAEMDLDNTVANVNTNHSTVKTTKKKDVLSKTEERFNKKRDDRKYKKDYKIKSKVVVPEKVNFEEDGEMVEMEISDGGAAAAEFASEEELIEENKSESEDSMESSSDEESGNEDDTESGEIQTQSDEEITEPSPERSATKDSELDELVFESPKPKKKKRKSSSKKAFQERLDTMSSTLLAMKELMVQSGLTGKLQGDKEKTGRDNLATESTSETMIYKNALKKSSPNEIVEVIDAEVSFKVKGTDRNNSSSSDEDKIDTSDEMLELGEVNEVNENVESFIADCAAEAARSRKRSMSRQEETERSECDRQRLMDEDPQQQAEKLIREAEASKARILTTPGKFKGNGVNGATYHSTMVDENYMAIGGFVEPNLCEKIVKGEFIDFGRLLPKGRNFAENTGRLELVNRGGQTFFVPSNRDQGVISSFSKWEQAFRVYSNICTRAHPDRAAELIQYNHIIFTAAATYTWDNVYTYEGSLEPI